MATVRNYSLKIILLSLGLVASLVLIVVFSMRAVRFAPHRMVDEPIRPWMTLSYVAHSYRVPSYVLFEALDIPYVSHDRRPLLRIARELNIPVDQVISRLQQAIIHSRPPYPTPLPFPSATPTFQAEPTTTPP